MEVFPAIDLLDGSPVRLRQGRFDEVSRFGGDALAIAAGYLAGGARWLHMVDLDGARQGGWRQLDLIAGIASALPLKIQAGGGVRQQSDIEAALDQGVSRVVVGTAAIASPSTFAGWARRFGEHLVVSLDTSAGVIAVRGWTDQTDLPLAGMAQTLCTAGAQRFIHTSIGQDGTKRGLDLDGLRQLVPLGRPVIVAGGVAGYPDIDQARDAGAEGLIIGRALLDGTLDLTEVLRRAAGA